MRTSRFISAFLIAGGFTSPTLAATRFDLKQITIDGSTAVNATAINTAGTIVGTFTDHKYVHGFILAGDKLTVMPPTLAGCTKKYSCTPYPTAIRGDGTVVGSVTRPYMGSFNFLFRNNKYVPSYSVPIGNPDGAIGPGIDNGGEIFYSTFGNDNTDDVIGTPPHVKPFHLCPSTAPGCAFQFINGLNNQGNIAGQYENIGVNPYTDAVFFGTTGAITSLSPPGAVLASGGFLNDYNEVAGEYNDSGNVEHGFVYSNGKYTSFDMPDAAADIQVQAINNKGRVVGVYTDVAKKVQRVFYYNGTTVSYFGKYRVEDQLTVTLNKYNVMVLSVNAPVAHKRYSDQTSYIVRCHGAGC